MAVWVGVSTRPRFSSGVTKAENDLRAPLETPCMFWEVGWGAAEVDDPGSRCVVRDGQEEVVIA
jgi:hypothetical protein